MTTIVDDVAGFAAGTCDADVIVSGIESALTLEPTLYVLVEGTTVPALLDDDGDWTTGTTTAVGGELLVDGQWITTAAYYAGARVLEFDATFGAAAFQHVGMAVDMNATPTWTIFSTGATDTNVYARTNNNGTEITNTDLGALVDEAHRYRIERLAGTVVYSVDGAVVATHTATMVDDLRPFISDYTADDINVAARWAVLTPFAVAGTFTSQVFDAGEQVVWDALTGITTLPAGTDVTFEVSTGDVAIPDGTWSTPVAPVDTVVGQVGRYLQYTAELTTSDDTMTPLLFGVTLDYSAETVVRTGLQAILPPVDGELRACPFHEVDYEIVSECWYESVPADPHRYLLRCGHTVP